MRKQQNTKQKIKVNKNYLKISVTSFLAIKLMKFELIFIRKS